MKIVIFGLTITSSWGNGHATTYRSLAKALTARGHQIHFIEKDFEWYRNNRDLPQPPYCKVHIYEAWERARNGLLRVTSDADVIVIGSYYSDAIAVTEALLDSGSQPILFYDIDTPVTMSRLRIHGGTEYLDAKLIPYYAAYLSFTGGPALRELERRFGSPRAVPFYCSVDPDLYKPTLAQERLKCHLSYLGTYAPDRQSKLLTMLNGAAELLPQRKFIVAGPQYPKDTQWKPNVSRIIHLSPPEHPAFYSSSRFTLNLTRDDMITAGYSPSVRLFEASACGAAILSDSWDGLDEFLTPNEEILLPKDRYEVAHIVQSMPDEDRRRIGSRARDRVLAHHSSQHRAVEFEMIVERCSFKRGRSQTSSSSKELMHKSGSSACSVSSL
jgi:spore maturation protein CgeB